MSYAVSGSDLLPAELQVLYAPIVDELGQSEDILQRELTSRHTHVDEMIRYGCLLGGKRLRPALLLLTAKATGKVTDEHLTLAAVVEMIHTATLIHDDVLDEAVLRRHLNTCNDRWDNKASVLLGDYLFTHAFFLASTLGSTYACQTIGKTTNTVCEGKLRQIRSCSNFDLDESAYLDIIDAKTATLCACACRLGAYYAGSSAVMVEALASYGKNLGIAFQIIDDLLDVSGDESSVGKSLGSDLDQHKPTLPLIHVLSQLETRQRSELLARLAPANGNSRILLDPWLGRCDTRDYVKQRAATFAERATAALNDLPATDALDVLRQLPEFVLHRER